VSDIYVRPRIELETAPAPRLEAELAVIPPPLPTPPSTLGLAIAGTAILGVGLAALQTANFVTDQFSRAPTLGWLTLAVAAGGFGLIFTGALREWRGMLGLQRVDHLRRDFLAADPAHLRSAARAWLKRLPDPDPILPAIEAADTPEAITALLRAGPLATLRARTDTLARTAAIQVFTASAAIPSPIFDGLLVAWRGLRLIRQIAELHGLRPGLLATVSLLRRTALSAAMVVSTDLAVSAALQAVATHPLLRHVAGDVAGATVAARRMLLLGRAAAAACTPIPDP
jgi:uncharacterized membrane protein YcjF (UPF0283 family)